MTQVHVILAVARVVGFQPSGPPPGRGLRCAPAGYNRVARLTGTAAGRDVIGTSADYHGARSGNSCYQNSARGLALLPTRTAGARVAYQVTGSNREPVPLLPGNRRARAIPARHRPGPLPYPLTCTRSPVLCPPVRSLCPASTLERSGSPLGGGRERGGLPELAKGRRERRQW